MFCVCVCAIMCVDVAVVVQLFLCFVVLINIIRVNVLANTPRVPLEPGRSDVDT